LNLETPVIESREGKLPKTVKHADISTSPGIESGFRSINSKPSM